MTSNDAIDTVRSFRIPPPSSSPQRTQPTDVFARRTPTGHYLRQTREETESPDQDFSNYQIHVHPDAGTELAEVRMEALTANGLNNGTVLPPVSPAYGIVNGNWDQFIFGPNGGGGGGLKGKEYGPLSRKISVSAAVLVPYRILIFFRMVVLVIYLAWRIRNKNEDAVWLWEMSVTCEIWFTISWLLEQLPKLSPVKRAAELTVLKDKFEATAGGKSDLPGIDVFVATDDPHREPPLVTANTILSVLAADYPVEKLACYLTDDAGSLLTFEAVAETASFAAVWVPFCRKHDIEARGPENYFTLKDPYRRNKMRPDFVRDRRQLKREYDEFKVRINALPVAIRRRSDAHNAHEESEALKLQRELFGDEPMGRPAIPRATWMADGSHWPGTWIWPSPQHAHGDHTAIIQVMLKSPSDEATLGSNEGGGVLDLAGVDVRLPMLVYVAREKRPGYDDNRKAGAMNALLRASAVISNGAFLLNLDFGNYVHNSGAFREGMCYMMDRGGGTISFVQFPCRFEGVDASDRYSNHNDEFFDVNMRALDGIQGPVYLGTGCLFRRMALYGFDPPPAPERDSGCCFGRKAKPSAKEREALRGEEAEILATYRKRFGNSTALIDSMEKAEFESRPIADDPGMKYGRPAGALAGPRPAVMPAMVAEAVSVVACSYEDKTEWGEHVGWIYGTVTEDIVTGYRMHERGWRSVYCATVRDAFRSTAPIDLADRLHRILRRAIGAVEIFFSGNNALFVTPGMKALQRVAYLNASAYPLASVFLTFYCFLPALCLFSGQFIVRTLSSAFLAFVLVLTVTLCVVAVLEIKWSGVQLVDWWRNEQLWVMGGTSAHLAALVVGLLKGVTGVNLSSKRIKKSGGGGAAEDGFAELDMVKWTSMMIPPITIMMVNLVAIAVGLSRTIYSSSPDWSKFLGGLVFSCWVLVHLYPFAEGLMGRKKKTPTIIFVWSGLIAITISLLWVAIKSPSGEQQIGGSITFP